ncbi:hypothetical protein AB0F72_39260 [Actinoplanes sp. NPDC023936]|uniref:hypothetical protein n=1 Tax=Actinoplanes sp. NPDC023936 TaxID=3154910 RepID=UPI0033E09F13
MEPTEALRSIETALRLLIIDVLGESSWLSSPGAPDPGRLEEKQSEEAKRRDGVFVSQNLIDYAETYHLTAMVEKSWEKFKPALKDRGRTLAFFGILEDIRNSVAHSRELAPFERDLISGISGQIRSQVSIYRSQQVRDGRYYPLIEAVKDNFGSEGQTDQGRGIRRTMRLDVGQTLTFEGSAFSARNKAVRWQVVPKVDSIFGAHDEKAIDAGEGETFRFDYTVKEQDVHETFAVEIRIAADSRFHRYGGNSPVGFDDSRMFLYAVNPPEGE